MATLPPTHGCPACGTGNPDGARFCNGCGAHLVVDSQDTAVGVGAADAGADTRRTVTVLFSDLVGSTALGEALEPETLRRVMARYFAAMSAILDEHGGTVEKFIGDAIMAVFGLPLLHEDDALRAVRAAASMQVALEALNAALRTEVGVSLAVRTGVHTGSVIAGDATLRQRLVTGDAVNVAARLEQAAKPGEILMGEETWRSVRRFAVAEPVEAITARGKSAPLAAYRLLRVGQPGGEGAIDKAPLIGRDAELLALTECFERTVRERTASLMTVAGPAGVGKSHLLAAFSTSLAVRATLLHGRCLSYGDSSTLAPIRQIVLAAAGISEQDTVSEARRRLGELVAGDADASAVGAVLGRLVGHTEGPVERDEIAWAVRRALAHLGRVRPVVLMVEDLHWASRPVLDVLVAVIDGATEMSLLVVCSTRPELFEGAPEWAGGPSSEPAVLRLDGLAPEAAEGLIARSGGNVLGVHQRERIAAAAAGNPLYLVEMTRMVTEQRAWPDARAPAGTFDLGMPPTIAALLSARLDQLPGSERRTAQRASVVGTAFEAATVTAISPQAERAGVPGDLHSLQRRDLLANEPSASTSDGAYRFRHGSIRDAAYESVLKSDRAVLHQRVADQLESVADDDGVDRAAVVGYHLEAAHRFRTELRDSDPEVQEIGRRAARALSYAAARARNTSDQAAAVGLLERAERLPTPGPRFHAELLLDLGHALSGQGQLPEARVRAAACMALVSGLHEPGLRARARLLRLDVSLADGSLDDAAPGVDEELAATVRDAELSGDPRALAAAWDTAGTHAYAQRRFVESHRCFVAALEHARASGDTALRFQVEGNLLVGALVGPTPLGEVVSLATRMKDESMGYPGMHAVVTRLLAFALAMTGDDTAAEPMIDSSIAMLAALSRPSDELEARMDKAAILRLAGDDPGAERELRRVRAVSHELGNASIRAWSCTRLAEVLVARGRLEEAEAMVQEAQRVGTPLLAARHIAVRAHIRATAGDARVAEDVERFVALLDGGHTLQKTDLLVEAAEMMLAVGQPMAARQYAGQASQLATTKENAVVGQRIDSLLGRIVEATTRSG